MRMRRKKHGAERIAACASLLINDTETLAHLGDADSTLFPPSEPAKPIHLEIGCGKGSFALGTASAHSDINLIAMERVPDVACCALEKAKAALLPDSTDNLRFLIGNAENLAEWVKPHSISRIYLNFSDPWPKKGYAKRRLTHRNFLAMYKNLLCENGELWLKTDNVGLFDFSLEEFEAMGLNVFFVSRDFHATPEAADNIMTEYETNFSSQGIPICCARVKF